MRLSVKKKIVMAGAVLFIGMASIMSQAYTTVNVSAGDQNVMAYGNGNINSSAFSYGGFRTGTYDNKYAVARIFVDQAFYAKSYEGSAGRPLARQAFSKTKPAFKRDEEGIRIIVKTYDSNGTSVIHQAGRVMRCN